MMPADRLCEKPLLAPEIDDHSAYLEVHRDTYNPVAGPPSQQLRLYDDVEPWPMPYLRHRHRHSRAPAVRHINLIWPAACRSGYAVSPMGLTGTAAMPYGRRLASPRYPEAPAVVRLGRSDRKIWSMTSAPVVITGRSSRR